MGIEEDTEYVGRLLDAYAAGANKMHVAAEDPEDGGVAPDMQAGDVSEDGWVQWRLLPSTLTEVDIAAVERELGAELPPLFRAYLLARFHLFEQVRSAQHGQLIMMTDTPSNRPLGPLQARLAAWRPLIDAGYVPFADWGDGWGPMCFDVHARGSDGDCPVVWIDHEHLATLGEPACRRREAVQPLAQSLYPSFRALLVDVFG